MITYPEVRAVRVACALCSAPGPIVEITGSKSSPSTSDMNKHRQQAVDAAEKVGFCKVTLRAEQDRAAGIEDVTEMWCLACRVRVEGQIRQPAKRGGPDDR